MTRIGLLFGGAAAALALSAGALVMAQDAPRPPPGAWRGQMQQRMQARRDQALADVRQVLKLRPDQEAAFQALQAALAPSPRIPRPPPSAEALTTPQMIARRADRMSTMKTEMDRRDQAVLRFYGALSPDQQTTFDSLLRLRRDGELLDGGPGMGRMGMGMRGIGHMGRGGVRGPDDGPPPPRR